MKETSRRSISLSVCTKYLSSVFGVRNEFIFSNGCNERQEMNWWCEWKRDMNQAIYIDKWVGDEFNQINIKRQCWIGKKIEKSNWTNEEEKKVFRWHLESRTISAMLKWWTNQSISLLFSFEKSPNIFVFVR